MSFCFVSVLITLTPKKTVRWYLDNREWMDNITSGDYERYYDDMYKNR